MEWLALKVKTIATKTTKVIIMAPRTPIIAILIIKRVLQMIQITISSCNRLTSKEENLEWTQIATTNIKILSSKLKKEKITTTQ